MGAPCMHAGGVLTSSQTTGSWVSHLRGDDQRHWATATAAPCTSVFKPVRIDRPVDLGPAPTDRADDASLWWRHERLHRLALADIEASVARFSADRDRLEARWTAAPDIDPDPFALAAEHTARWRLDLETAQLPDRRPRWLRALWAREDRLAGLSGEVGA
jgi:hypothetical protein